MIENGFSLEQQPLVSIIMPVYNTEQYLAETVASVLDQTYTNWELLLINDGSTDNSADVAKSFLGDARITYLEHPNSRAAFTRNRGIMASRGDLIAFLDSDDVWDREKLAIQISQLQQHPEAGVAYTQREVVDAQGVPIPFGYRPKLYSGNVLNELYVDSFICTSSAIVRKAVFQKVGLFNDQYRVSEDWDFWLRAASCFPFIHNDKMLVKYRVHGTQVSRNLAVRIAEVWEIRKNLEPFCGTQISTVARRRAKALHFSHKAYRAEGVESLGYVLKNYLTALAWYPFDLFSLRGMLRVVAPTSLYRLCRRLRNT